MERVPHGKLRFFGSKRDLNLLGHRSVLDQPEVHIMQSQEHRDISAFESRIDKLHLGLGLRHYPKNLALWALVTNGLERLYQKQQEQVPERDRTIQTMLSRSFGLFIRQVDGYPSKGHAAIKNLRLDPAIRSAAAQANAYARFWFGATGYFPEWHRGECTATLVSQNSIRFHLLNDVGERAVSAYQKSFRPTSMRIPSESVYAPIPPWINEEYSRALALGATRDGRLLYRIPQTVYEFYDDWYRRKMAEAVEHPVETNLGAYDIGDATSFWAALVAFASVHDYLCYVAGQRAGLPFNSILPVKKREDWTREIGHLSGLIQAKCDAILEHIICRPRSVIDLHVTPFLAMDDKARWLALAAPLAISGRFDQNLLRVCSAGDPDRFNKITPKKEQRLRDEVTIETAPLRVRALGPFKLPSPLPDVDLILEDMDRETIVISELKWVRSPIGWKSRQRCNDELNRGLTQLRDIRGFLTSNPGYLASRPNGISKPISQFRTVYYSLFARGHLIRIVPKTDESMLPFDALKFALKSERHLDCAMNWLLDDSWLPKEGIDFRVRSSRFVFEGYEIEAPLFTPP